MTRSLILAIVLLGSSAAQALAGNLPEPTMSISATGTVTAEPDQAVIRFGVHSTGVEAADAMDMNKEAMQAAFSALLDAGVSPQQITTTGLALNPRYDDYQRGDGNTPPKILGYEAHNIVSATVTDLSGLGDVLDELVDSGVNGIDQISFGLQDTSALEAEARIKAAKMARAKAQSYADAIGTKITGVISISEKGTNSLQPYTMLDATRTSVASAMPVSGGELDVSVTVNVVFGLDGTLD